MSEIIKVEGVFYRHHRQSVLEDIHFSIKKGDYLGIIGPNGGGKTTLVKILLGLIKPDQGEVLLFGKSLSKLKNRHRIGYVPQMPSQKEQVFPATVEEIVKSGRIPKIGLFRRFGPDDQMSVENAMRQTGVDRHRKKLIGRLSGGERQLVYIARALAAEPELLIMDEPVVGVDPGAKDHFYSFLSQLNQQEDMTILFVSHEVGVITKEAKNVLCLNRKLISHGPPENFIKEEVLERLYGKKQASMIHHH